MPFTGLLGHSDSRLGNIVLGLGSSKGRRFRRSSKTPHYRLQAFDFADTSTFGVGTMIAEFDRFKNLGWADFLNGVPQIHATLNQDDPKITLLRGKSGKMHYRLYRDDWLVQVGWLGFEVDANSRDAILYGYGYLSALFFLNTAWQQEWTSQTVATIVSDSWTRAKTTLTNSRLKFVNTGTIQSPPTVSGGSTPITLPFYAAFYKRILFLMQEMAAIGASDTGNSTVFEITNSIEPTFNFWKDRSFVHESLGWQWNDGLGKIADFQAYEMPIYHRNDALAVGSTPRDLVLRNQIEDTTDMTTGGWGRMSESLFFAWVRDETELQRVSALRAARGKRDQPQVTLIFHPGTEAPPGTSESAWQLGDKTPIKIDRGITNIDTTYQIVGHLTLVADGNENVRAMLQEPV